MAASITVEELAALAGAMLIGVLWIRARLGRDLDTTWIARSVWIGVALLAVVAVWGLATVWRATGLPGPLPPWPASGGATGAGAAVPYLFGLALALSAVGGGDVLSRAAHEFPPPRVQALRRTGVLVVAFGFLATAIPAYLFGVLVPGGEQAFWVDAHVAGLAMHVAGPSWARAIVAIVIVAAACLLLVPAAHAAFSGAEQMLRRLSAEHALPEGLASPHPRFGTLARAVDVTAAGSVLIMLASGGRVEWLGRAYAFSVAATLLIRVAALVRLRRTCPTPRAFKAPFNLRLGGREIPVGLLATGGLVVAAMAGTFLAGDFPSIATAVFLGGLVLLLAPPGRRVMPVPHADEIDSFELLPSTDLSLDQVQARPDNVLVPVRNPHALAHVGAALHAAGSRDVVVMTVRLLGIDVDDDPTGGTDPTPYERQLFSQVVAIAERAGRPVRLLIVPATNVFDAVVATVLRLRSSEVYVGESTSLSADDQARLLGEAWEEAPKPADLKVRLVIVHHSGRADAYHLGAHPPALTPGDLDLIHRVWLDVTKAVGPHVHHHDVVRAALTQMERQLSGPQRDEALAVIRQTARPADELAAAVHARDFTRLRDITRNRHASDLAAVLTELNLEDQVVVFRVLQRKDAAAVFEYLSLEAQEALLKAMAQEDVAALLNEMAPDDRTMFLEELPAAATRQLLTLLTPAERAVALTLLGYPEDSVGRLMTPEYVRVKESWTINEVLDHIRRHGQDSETLNVIYVVDEPGVLVDDIRIRELLLASPGSLVSDLMDRRFVALKATDDKRSAVAAFRRYDRTALPVTDSAGMLIGIVTIDDVLDVVEAAATEEIQKIGGSQALEEPYMETAFARMIQKRAGWLTALFLGEMLTATAMGFFEAEISKAVVLALFVPLIISSGGNSGSQASTLVIRALALSEVTIADWWRVVRREVYAGLALGAILGIIGFARIALGSAFSDVYGPFPLLVAATVGLTLVGVVCWGTIVGSLLPFVMRRLGFDPATSSAPFVATLVDVTGLVIYFSVAAITLKGTLL
jgi:magnesium transporter